MDKDNRYEITELTNDKLELWFGLKIFVKSKIEGTELEKLFLEKFEKRDEISYKSSQELFMSENIFYRKLYEIYEIAKDYISWHRLIIL